MSHYVAQEPSIVVSPAETLPMQPWWQELHLTINTSFKNKDFAAFPPTWDRLPADSAVAAKSLAEELGSNGIIAVVLVDDHPVACGGVTPFRGDNWIDAVESAESMASSAAPRQHQTASDQISQTEDWELCCVCVHPHYRRTGLSEKIIRALEQAIRPSGARRLMSTYVMEHTGAYWQHLGFEVVPGAGGVLKKGFTAQPGMPGLLEDIHFEMGRKLIK